MAVRTVYDTIFRPDGSPWVGALLSFKLDSFSVTADGIYLPDTTATTAADGTFSVDLAADLPSTWSVTFPDGTSYRDLVITAGAPITLTELIAVSGIPPAEVSVVQTALDAAIGPLTTSIDAIETTLTPGAEGQILEVVDGVVTWVDPDETGESIFFLEGENDPVVADYGVMDNPAQLEVEAYAVQSTVTDGALIRAWITDVGLPGTTFLPSGVWQFHINAFRAAGNRETRLYTEIYKRTVGGVETLLESTANSIPLTTTEAVLPAFNVYIPALTLLATDRIVVKVRIRLIGTGSIPTSVTLGYSGATAARLSLPSQAVDVTGINAAIAALEARIAALEEL